MTNFLRPDEQVRESEIERAQARDRNLKKGVKTAASVGAGVAGLAGANIASKIAPFLSEYIPSDLAIKGISKVAPKVGDFLKRGLNAGLDIKSGLDYLKKDMFPEKEAEKQAQQNGNVIEQYSPELHQFIETEVQKGRSPLEAGAVATTNPKFKQVIDKLSKDHKSPWSAIIQTVYGGGQSAQQPTQGQQQQSQQAAQQDPNSMLMAALDKIMKM